MSEIKINVEVLLTIWKDEFIWQIKIVYKAFSKLEMN